jgi:hypothetical protein
MSYGSYLCIELNLSGIDLWLQLKISHGLVDIYVMDRSYMPNYYICIYDL